MRRSARRRGRASMSSPGGTMASPIMRYPTWRPISWRSLRGWWRRAGDSVARVARAWRSVPDLHHEVAPPRPGRTTVTPVVQHSRNPAAKQLRQLTLMLTPVVIRAEWAPGLGSRFRYDSRGHRFVADKVNATSEGWPTDTRRRKDYIVYRSNSGHDKPSFRWKSGTGHRSWRWHWLGDSGGIRQSWRIRDRC